MLQLDQVLKRRRPLPKIKSATGKPASSEQLLEYALEVNEVLRAEYTEKQSLAMEAIHKCTRMVQNECRNQLSDLEKCDREKESLVCAIRETQSKFDQIQNRQSALSEKVESILDHLKTFQPQLSQDEVKMRSDLEEVQRKCVQYVASLNELRERQQFQTNALTSEYVSTRVPADAVHEDDSQISSDELRNLELVLQKQ